MGDPNTMKSNAYKPPSPSMKAPFVNRSAKGILKFLDNMRNKITNSQYNFLYEPQDYSVTLKESQQENNGYKSYNMQKPKLDLESLLQSWIGSDKKITILDLSNVPSEIKSSVSGTILNIIYDALFWGQNLDIGGKKRPILIVLEEAHTYLKSGEKSISARITQKIAKEGRKYGCGLLLVTQRPSELDETILSQCGTLIALRLNNSNDKARVASCIQDELQSITNLLPSLKIGEGLVSGEAVKIPSRVKFYKIKYAPKSADPEVVKQWSGDLNEKKEDYEQLVKMWRLQNFLINKKKRRVNMSLPEMIKVVSSNIDEIGYNKEQQELYIRFVSGSLYVYRNVPEIEFTSLKEASSHGTYLSDHIKHQYPYERI